LLFDYLQEGRFMELTNVGGMASVPSGALRIMDANQFAYPNFSFLNDKNTGFANATNNRDNLYVVTDGAVRATFNEIGNVGIGTTNPSEKIEIGGDSKLNLKIGRWATIGTTGGGLATIIGNNIKASQSINNKMEFITTTNGGAKAIKMQYNEGITFHTMLGSVTSNSQFSGYERMRIDNNGNVGIGTQTTGSHKLAVEGSIGAREIKVEAFPNWSDFVFEKEYNLPSLREVEKHIKEKGHLKDIPSAKEVEKNGIFLGEMNSKLLQKIEELTLYTIAQEKKIKELESLNTKFIELQKRMEKLEKK